MTLNLQKTYLSIYLLLENALNAIFQIFIKVMDYKKKSLNKLNQSESYEEIDTRLASGWYVDSFDNNKKKKYKTKGVSFKISKKL
jgi:hypothetical protein